MEHVRSWHGAHGRLRRILPESGTAEVSPGDRSPAAAGRRVYTIDGQKAREIVEELKPKIVIPMHYKTEQCKIGINDLTEFIEDLNGVKQMIFNIVLLIKHSKKNLL